MGGSDWYLAFTIYIASGGSFISPVTDENGKPKAYEEHGQCVTDSFGKEREKRQKENPDAAIAGYCVPLSWLVEQKLKVLGWH